jgi:hypothetical protein
MTRYLLAFLLFAFPAAAQIGGNGGGINGNSSISTSGGTFTGPVVFNNTINGWTPLWVMTPNGGSVVSGGTGYVVGDVLTLLTGCTTNPTLVVAVVTGGVVQASGYNVVSTGSCAVVPSGTFSVTGGTGTGATFSGFTWVPAPPATTISGTLFNNNGNLFIGEEGPTKFSGTESVFIGDRAGGRFISGNFNVAIGHDACGIGAGVDLTISSSVCVGTDAGRNIGTSSSRSVVIGTGAAKNINAADNVIIGAGAASSLTSSAQSVLIGSNASQFLTTGQGNVAVGYQSGPTASGIYDGVFIGGSDLGGGNGARGGSTSVILGARGGNGSLTGSNVTAIGFNVAATNCTTGNNILLLGTNSTTDCSAAGVSNEIHIGAGSTDILKVTGTNAPTSAIVTVSGPVVLGGTKFTASGCSNSTTTGQGTAGTFKSGTTGTCTVTITLNGATGITAPNGWICTAFNRTTTANLMLQTVDSTTGCTIAGTTVTNDIIAFYAQPY